MDDLISRAAARDVINTWGRKENEDVRMNLLHKDLNAIPAVDAVPVKHGLWKTILNPLWDAECSECGYAKRNGWEWEFCPNCGAKMDGGSDG